jgi:hypothetical protein
MRVVLAVALLVGCGTGGTTAEPSKEAPPVEADASAPRALVPGIGQEDAATPADGQPAALVDALAPEPQPDAAAAAPSDARTAPTVDAVPAAMIITCHVLSPRPGFTATYRVTLLASGLAQAAAIVYPVPGPVPPLVDGPLVKPTDADYRYMPVRVNGVVNGVPAGGTWTLWLPREQQPLKAVCNSTSWPNSYSRECAVTGQ